MATLARVSEEHGNRLGELTVKNGHGFTPVSFRNSPFMGTSAGKTPVSY